MIVNYLLSIGAAIVLIFTLSAITRHVANGDWRITLLSQFGSIIGLAVGLVYIEYISALMGASLVLIPIGLYIFAFYWIKRENVKMLDGSRGEETMWGAELVMEDEDQEFAQAAALLPEMEIKEIGVVAESKEELREITIERYEELSEDN